MRILVVSNFFPPHVVGGAEIVAHRHALEMRARGHEVCVYAGRLPGAGEETGGLFLEEVDGLSVYRTVVRSLDPDRAFFWRASARNLEAVSRAERPDIVHFHNVIGLGANLIARAKSLGVRTIVTLHDYWGFCFRQTMLDADNGVCSDFDACHRCLSHITTEDQVHLPIRLRRDYVAWCLDQADTLVSPSRWLAQQYETARIGAGRIGVCSNGVEAERFASEAAPRERRKVRFLFIGHWGVHKGLKVLMDAAQRLAERTDLAGQWELSLVGDGALAQWLRARAAEIGSDAIAVLGAAPRDRIPALMAAHDVLVVPSIWPENEPVVLLESIAAGMAQIATRLGGNCDLVEHGEGGVLIDVGAEALADAMLSYIGEPARAARHGAWNFARRAALSQSASCDRYEQLYQAPPAGADAPQADILVLCGGRTPTMDLAHLISNLSLLEGSGRRVRLAPAAWADAHVWPQAAALWVWSAEFDEALIRQALRRGLAILAPRHHPAAGWLEHEIANAFIYEDPIGAAAILSALAAGEAPPAPAARAFAGDLVTAFSRAASFELLTGGGT